MAGRRYTVLGLMSGSSLDGLDLALAQFEWTDDAATSLRWQLLTGETRSYPRSVRIKLTDAPAMSGLELAQLHADLGHYFGREAASFLRASGLEADLVASHGHTVFHYPDRGLTLQIGDGAAIAARTGLPVVDQLRSCDLALGGQGAPLAPLADRYLFPDYEACLNIGGIANLSVAAADSYIAFDIGGANQLLDRLARMEGKEYDEDGRLAAAGRLLPGLYGQLNSLPWFSHPYPKSLGNDWVVGTQWPLIRDYDAPVADRLYTVCRHLSHQVAVHLDRVRQQEHLPAGGRMLLSGGGALNRTLVRLLHEALGDSISAELPSDSIIHYKEGLLIALAGFLRLQGLPNSLSTVTGARKDAINGALWAAQ